MRTENQCDSCGKENKKTARLAMGDKFPAYLCAKCWAREMAARSNWNKNLKKELRFDIFAFPKEGAPITCKGCGEKGIPAEWEFRPGMCGECVI